MKIIQLTAENVKKLTAVEISPDGNMVQITGKNGQGKTSVLDSIWWALAGTGNIQKAPIRKGQEKARIELKLGTGKTVELIVERRFSETASYLDVKTAEGAKYPGPQKLLDDLLGSLTFDPLGFMRTDGKGQFEILKGLVKLDIDPAKIDLDNKADFDKRTGINRDAKAKRAQASAIVVADDLPDRAVDESALLDELQTAANENADIERRRANRQEATAKIASERAAADRMRDQANGLRAQADDLIAKADASDTVSSATEKQIRDAGALPEPVDISELRARLDEAKATNALVADRDRRAAIEAEALALENQSTVLTEAIDKRNADKAAAIAKADMPVEGLSFGDGLVTFNGLPLEQASDAEQLMASTAIAAAINPKLRVIRIRDGSLLDDDAMKQLAAFADKNDMQIWIERVDGSGTVGVVMEDGHVKGHEPKLQAEAAE